MVYLVRRSFDLLDLISRVLCTSEFGMDTRILQSLQLTGDVPRGQIREVYKARYDSPASHDLPIHSLASTSSISSDRNVGP